MGTIANIKKVVERIAKSVCGNSIPDLCNDLNRQLPLMREAVEQITDLPLVLNDTGEAKTILAFSDPQDFVAAPLRWAVCVGGIQVQPALVNGWVGLVRGKRCRDHKGNNFEVDSILFYLRGKDGQTYVLNDGDVFAYLLDRNGKRFIIMDPLDETGGGGAGDDATYQEEGVTVGQQPRLNFIAGSDISLDVVDDPGNTRVNVTINSTYNGAGDGSSWIEWTATGDMTANTMTVDVDEQWGPFDPGATATVDDRSSLFQYALDGAFGIAVYDTEDNKWIVIQSRTKAGWGYGDCLANMAGTPKKASFQVDGYGGTQQDVQNPGTTIDVYGITGFTDALEADAPASIMFNTRDGRYYAIAAPATYQEDGVTIGCVPILNFLNTGSVVFAVIKVGNTMTVEAEAQFTVPDYQAGTVKFELLADMAGSGGASALLLDFYGSTTDTLTPGTPIIIYDDEAEFPYALEGAIGTAHYDRVENKYRVTHCQQMATDIRGTIPDSLDPCGLLTSTGSFSVDVDDIFVMSHKPFNQKPTGPTISVYNDGGWSAPSGSTFYAKWDNSATKWVMYQLFNTRCEDPEDC